MIKIEKIINNNIISSSEPDGNEIVVMGRGVGFQKKRGDIVPKDTVEKIFRIDNEDSMERFKNLLKNLPIEYIQLADEIISYAKEHLDMHLSESVYLTLTDHISFVIDQYKEGRVFNNMLLEEVKRFYPEEYMAGMHAILLIKEKTGCSMLEDEAASIAMHLVNAEFDLKVKDTWTMTNMIRDILNLVEYELGVEDDDSFYKGWFVINLKFLAHRMLRIEPKQNLPDQNLFQFAKKQYAEEYSLICRVKQFVEEKYHCEMTEEEKLYLLLEIKRVKDLYL